MLVLALMSISLCEPVKERKQKRLINVLHKIEYFMPDFVVIVSFLVEHATEKSLLGLPPIL